MRAPVIRKMGSEGAVRPSRASTARVFGARRREEASVAPRQLRTGKAETTARQASARPCEVRQRRFRRLCPGIWAGARVGSHMSRPCALLREAAFRLLAKLAVGKAEACLSTRQSDPLGTGRRRSRQRRIERHARWRTCTVSTGRRARRTAGRPQNDGQTTSESYAVPAREAVFFIYLLFARAESDAVARAEMRFCVGSRLTLGSRGA